jgi:hypothetical protein
MAIGPTGNGPFVQPPALTQSPEIDEVDETDDDDSKTDSADLLNLPFDDDLLPDDFDITREPVENLPIAPSNLTPNEQRNVRLGDDLPPIR